MTTPEPDYITRIAELGSCGEALDWLRTERHPDLATAWAACHRGDWMLWLAGRVAGPPGDARRVPLVLAACDCAELALVHVPAGEDRPQIAVATARRWARGEATLDEVRTAADAADAYAAAYAAVDAAYYAAYAAAYAAADAAADAAYAAAYAADAYAYAAAYAADAAYAAYAAAYAAADAAADAAYAAYAATYAAAYAYAAAARADTLARCADLVRAHYPTPPEIT